MEFKFRAIDKQPSTYQPPSSSFSYFTEQAIRAGNYTADFGRNREFLGNPLDVREAIRRELEKERIREEIIAGEIERKRALEAEVRMEMMMEREMALRRSNSFTYPPPMASRLEPSLSVIHQSQGRSLEERIAWSLEERFGHLAGRRIGGIEPMPFHRNVDPIISEVKPSPPMVSKDKAIALSAVLVILVSDVLNQRLVDPEVLILSVAGLAGVSCRMHVDQACATPNTNLSGAKRKPVTPLTSGPNEVPINSKNKKPKEEWSCAICQVSATSEHILNEHLQGRKHKAKEAGLRAQKEGKNFGIGLILKEATTKPTKFTETTQHPISQKVEKPLKEPPKFNKTGILSNQKAKNTKNLKKNDGEMNNGDCSKKEGKPTWHCESNYKFWCEMCQCGADAEIVMEAHKNGKRHQYRLQQLNKKGGGATADLAAAQSVEVNQKVNRMENGASAGGKGDVPEKIDGDGGRCEQSIVGE
ncbi:hypothetical protein LguiB_024377 [Lonicera macranthoides]